MNITLDLQVSDQQSIPSKDDLLVWINSALEVSDDTHITLCVVSVKEIQSLNKTYRNKDKPTNVLSFTNEAPAHLSDGHLGDIVICHDILVDEAKAQDKLLRAHWAHMVIHSTLHLQGYDHQNDTDAKIMENIEIKLLQNLGFSNPYMKAHHG